MERKKENFTIQQQVKQDDEQKQVYMQVQGNPYANISGYNLVDLYNRTLAKKQEIDWQFYYLCLEMQNRLNYIEQNGKDSLPEYYIPSTRPLKPTVPEVEQPTKQKIVISEEAPTDITQKSPLLGKSQHQDGVDALVKQLTINPKTK